MAERRSGGPGSDGHDASGPARTRRPSPAELARRAARQLAGLIGREPEGVIGLERTDDGWRVGVEVVELRRIPDSADILAEYAVDLNRAGALTGYHRAARYTRGQTKDTS